MEARGNPPPPEAGAPPESGEGPRSLEQVDRRLSTRTYAGAALVVLALAAAIVALVIAVDARDNSARDSRVDQLERRLGGVAEQADASVATQESVDSLTDRVDSLESELDGVKGGEDQVDKRISVLEDDIEDLRQQISELDSGSGSSAGDSGGDSGGN